MNERQKIRTITVRDLLTLFLSKLWIIILIPLFCVAGVFIEQYFFFVPQYESTATLYILKQESEASNYTTSDFSLALDVVNDCTYILKSHAVLDEVIETLTLDTVSYTHLTLPTT